MIWRKGRKEPEQKSRVISARLHPEDEHEGAALEIFDALVAQGYRAREIITDALLHADGRKPDMFKRNRDVDAVIDSLHDLPAMASKIDGIADVLSNQIADLLKNIKSADPAAFRAFANHETDDDNALTDDFVENARKATRKTFRQRGGE